MDTLKRVRHRYKAFVMSRTPFRTLALFLFALLCQTELLLTSASQDGSFEVTSGSFYGETIPINTSLSSSLHVCLQFTVTQHGILFITQTSNTTGYLALTLNNATLEVTLHSTADMESLLSVSLEANQTISPQWVTLELTVLESQLSLTMDGDIIRTDLPRPVVFTGSHYFGGAPPNSFNISNVNFVGCLSAVAINSQSIVFPSSPRVGYNPGCCVPPRRMPLTLSGDFNSSLWESVSVQVRAVTVDEGDNVTITEQNINLIFPDDLIGYWLRSDIEDKVVFDVTTPPSFGGVFKGQSSQDIVSFTYHDVISDQITYRHGGLKGTADSAVIRARLECEDGGDSPFSPEFTLPFSIVEVNEKPYVAQQSIMSIAFGTRRVITPAIITVRDQETTNSSKITYSVEYIATVAVCGSCLNAPRGQVERTDSPGSYIKFFSQDNINRGLISFQHFAEYGNESVTIGLRVQDDDVGGRILAHIKVLPRVGHISITTEISRCLFLEDNHKVMIETSHLNSTTDFQDQNPVVTFDVTSPPTYGRLEVFETRLQRWSLVNETIGSHVRRPGVVGFFTQSDVDKGYVRFVHQGDSEAHLDSIELELRSSQLIGTTFTLCFNIIPKSILEQPEINVRADNLEVTEGGRAIVDPTVLDASFDLQEFLYAPAGLGPNIEIEDVVPVFVLVGAPQAGSIEVRGQAISTDGSFTLENLRGGVVYYNHSGVEGLSDSFSVVAYPTVEVPLIVPPDPSPIVTVSVRIDPVNNKDPVYSSAQHIVVTEGSYVNVTRNNILIEDEDLPGDRLSVFLRKPRAHKPNEIQTGYFAFFGRTNYPINRFTMADITAGKIIFIHRLNASANLTYYQTLKIEDGAHLLTPKPQIKVEAIPHNLVVQVNSDYIIHLDATVPPLIAGLDYNQFTFSMLDMFGEDSNLIGLVDVTVSNPPSYGQLYKVIDSSNGDAPIHLVVDEFTVNDLKMKRIEYHFTSQSSVTIKDNFTLIFKYGHSRGMPVTITVCVDPIPLPDTVHVQSALVSQEGVTTINSTHLRANNTLGESDDTVLFEILVPPTIGLIVNQSDPSHENLILFSQSDIEMNHVGYLRNRGTSRLSDSLTFRVCTFTNECTQPKELQLILHYVDLSVVNRGINVREGGNHTFSLDDLSATSPPGYSTVRFFPQYEDNGGPINGQLVLDNGPEGISEDPRRFNLEDIEYNRLIYRHNGRENLHDSFKVNIIAESMSEEHLVVTEFVNIRITPVNNHLPVIINRTEGLVVGKSGSVQISTLDLSAHDYDSDINDLDLVYTSLVDTPVYGYLYLDVNGTVTQLDMGQWTERDIREGNLYYKNTNPDAIEDFIALRLDESYTLASRTQVTGTTEFFKFIIKNIVFKSKAISSQFTVVEGEQRNITSRFLSYTAVNDVSLVDEDIHYNIVTPPERGHLTSNGVPLTTFTQQLIVNEGLVYVHDHSNELKDSFKYNLSVPKRQSSDSELYVFVINVDVVDDDPPIVTYIKDPVLVVERSVVMLNETVIEIHDLDTTGSSEVHSDRIQCTLVQNPTNGLVQRARVGLSWELFSPTFTKYDIEQQALRYNHSNVGQYHDQFEFSVTDGINHQNTTYIVNIVILPNEVAIYLHSLTVDEDSSAYLEPESFVVLHEYLQTVPGTIVIIKPPRGGFLENTLTGEQHLNHFTTEQLGNQSIMYVHLGGEDEYDSFTLYYQSHDPDHLNRRSANKTFEIIVSPNNDQRPVLDPNRILLLSLWDGEIKPLNESYFNASDGDNRHELLRYNLYPGEFDGYIAFTNDTDVPISTFTQADVSERRISFVHQTDQDGNISYNVTDGEYNTTGNLAIVADPLNLFCNVSNCLWDTLTVTRGGESVLSFGNLCCSTNDADNDREIMYHIMAKEYGEFLINSTPVNVFTKRQLEEGVVSYQHTDMSRWENEDAVQVTVETDFNTQLDLLLRVKIDLPQRDNRAAINTGLQVVEGNSSCLNESMLDATNVRYLAWMNASSESMVELEELDIHFVLSRLPSHGSLVVRGIPINSFPAYFTHNDLVESLVCYHHDDSESEFDKIQFRLSVVGSKFAMSYTQVDSVNITITPVNDITPSLSTADPSVQLVEGFIYTLTNNDLEIVDNDSEPSDIIITLDTLPINAEIFLKQRPLKSGDNFTQSHINMGHVTLKPVLSSQHGNFQFHFTDSYKTVANNTVYEFVVIVVPHTLQVLGTKRLNYRQNELKVKITKEFLYSDTNGHKDETMFILTTPPTDGWIGKMSAKLVSVTSFSQADIDGEVVWYIPNDGSREHSDSFVVNVSNTNLTITAVTVEVHTLVWGDIKNDTVVDFSEIEDSDVYVFRLPRDTIKLKEDNKHPEITLLDPPKYGYLFIMIDTRSITKRSMNDNAHSIANRAASDSISFHYDDLLNGWIFYSWSYEGSISSTITDNFTLLVDASSMRPGEAFVELTIVPPALQITQPITTERSPITVVETDPTPEPDSGFPVFTLIPILGVIGILVIMIIVIIVFCLSQQKRVRKKLQPTLSHPTPQYPWSVSPPLSSPRPVVAHYNFDLNEHEAGENEDQNSVSSGFSDQDEMMVASPTHSQSFSYSPQYIARSIPSPTYTTHQPLPPLAHRPRVRSNVSITVSGRQSVLSEMSLEEPTPPYSYSHSLPRPPLSMAVPVPVRPSSHIAFRAGASGVSESGYNSYNHNLDNSRLQSQSSVVCDQECDEHFPSALEDDVQSEQGVPVHDVKEHDHMTTISVVSGKALERDVDVCEGGGLHELLDLNDPNVQRLFKSTHPVLKKQEYWF